MRHDKTTIVAASATRSIPVRHVCVVSYTHSTAVLAYDMKCAVIDFDLSNQSGTKHTPTYLPVCLIHIHGYNKGKQAPVVHTWYVLFSYNSEDTTHSSSSCCETENFVENHLCKLRVIVRSRLLQGVYHLISQCLRTEISGIFLMCLPVLMDREGNRGPLFEVVQHNRKRPIGVSAPFESGLRSGVGSWLALGVGLGWVDSHSLIPVGS